MEMLKRAREWGSSTPRSYLNTIADHDESSPTSSRRKSQHLYAAKLPPQAPLHQVVEAPAAEEAPAPLVPNPEDIKTVAKNGEDEKAKGKKKKKKKKEKKTEEKIAKVELVNPHSGDDEKKGLTGTGVTDSPSPQPASVAMPPPVVKTDTDIIDDWYNQISSTRRADLLAKLEGEFQTRKIDATIYYGVLARLSTHSAEEVRRLAVYGYAQFPGTDSFASLVKLNTIEAPNTITKRLSREIIDGYATTTFRYLITIARNTEHLDAAAEAIRLMPKSARYLQSRVKNLDPQTLSTSKLPDQVKRQVSSYTDAVTLLSAQSKDAHVRQVASDALRDLQSMQTPTP